MTISLHKQRCGERLRLSREALGLTQAELARALGVDRGRLNHWEKGRYYPPPEHVLRLWQSYRITADWIYLGERGGMQKRLVDSLPEAEAALPAALLEQAG